jgi:hypothetical protein
LTPLDFFGCIKNYIYIDKTEDLNDLKARREATEQVTKEICYALYGKM